jgi:hypothetical protein
VIHGTSGSRPPACQEGLPTGNARRRGEERRQEERGYCLLPYAFGDAAHGSLSPVFWSIAPQRRHLRRGLDSGARSGVQHGHT